VANSGGDGISLREAILAANASAAADVIDFAPSVTGTIQLTNVGHLGEIGITNNLTINGPGAGVLTVRAQGKRMMSLRSDYLGVGCLSEG